MKKNLYYRTVFRRENLIKKAIYDFFLGIASYPRLLLEVFIRKNFGERYFSVASVLTIAAIMLFFPGIINSIMGLLFDVRDMRSFSGDDFESYSRHRNSFFSESPLWYLFITAFLVFSTLRYLEIRRNPSVYDFKRFSLSTGQINPLFYKIQLFGKPVSTRWVEIYFEPLLFFIVGLILYLINHKLGILICISAICYSLSYAGAYRNGDNFVMDKIDEMILNENQYDAFVGDMDADKTAGIRFYADRPNSEELREKVLKSFVEGDDDTVVS